jgi:hypothetical protein
MLSQVASQLTRLRASGHIVDVCVCVFAAEWCVAIGDEDSCLIDFGPLTFDAVPSSAAGEAAALPPLPEGVAQVEGMAEFSSAKVSNTLLRSGLCCVLHAACCAPLATKLLPQCA